MKKYELTFIFAKENKAVGPRLEKMLEVVKAKLVKKDDWGVKRLAYPIKKLTEAKFLHFQVEMEAKQIKELEAKIKLEEKLLRYLIICVK